MTRAVLAFRTPDEIEVQVSERKGGFVRLFVRSDSDDAIERWLADAQREIIDVIQDDWPVHQPEAPDAPIPGRHWYSACDDSRSRVNPATGVCSGCGGRACGTCGRENCPTHIPIEGI